MTRARVGEKRERERNKKRGRDGGREREREGRKNHPQPPTNFVFVESRSEYNGSSNVKRRVLKIFVQIHVA